MEGEAIMICIDTSRWIAGNDDMFQQQLDAIRLYCSKKLESHEDTVIGICGLGDRSLYHIVTPNNCLQRIMTSLYRDSLGGFLALVDSVAMAHLVWFGCRGKELGKHLPKRIAVFAGGPLYHDEMGDVEILGKAMKVKNVACDAITFGHPARNKQELFKTLINAADNNGNCNLVHVPPESSVYDALLRSRIIQSGSAPFASLPVQPESLSSEQNIMTAAALYSVADNTDAAAALYSVADNTDAISLSRSRVIPHVGGSGPLVTKVNQENPKPDQKAAANYPENYPHDHPALYQSVVDLSLENVKGNSQAETLDQRIERAKRELESLIMQKKKITEEQEEEAKYTEE